MKAGEVNADELWQVAWTYIKTVVDTLREPFLVLNEDLEVISANKQNELKNYQTRNIQYLREHSGQNSNAKAGVIWIAIQPNIPMSVHFEQSIDSKFVLDIMANNVPAAE